MLPEILQKLSDKRRKFVNEAGFELGYMANVFQNDMATSILKELRPYLTDPWSNKFDGTETEKLLRSLTRLEKEIYQDKAGPFISKIKDNLVSLSAMDASYMSALLNREANADSIGKILYNYMGWDPEKGKFIPGGPFDSEARNLADIGFAKKEAIKAVTTGVGWKQFEKDFAELMYGPEGKPGLIDKRVRQGIFDVYQDFDRTLITQLAEENEIEHFVYQGGLMITSRPFCIERNNKVFTKEEIASWKELKFQGKTNPYDPFVHAGGYNCRHNYDPISPELYEELLAEQEGDEAARGLMTELELNAAAQAYLKARKKGTKGRKKSAIEKKIEDYTGLSFDSFGKLGDAMLSKEVKTSMTLTKKTAHYAYRKFTAMLPKKTAYRYKSSLNYGAKVLAHEVGHAWHFIRGLIVWDWTDSKGNKYKRNIDPLIEKAFGECQRLMYDPVYVTKKAIKGAGGSPDVPAKREVVTMVLKPKYARLNNRLNQLASEVSWLNPDTLKKSLINTFKVDEKYLTSEDAIKKIANSIGEDIGDLQDTLQALSFDTEIGSGHGNNYNPRKSYTQSYFKQSRGILRYMEFFAHCSENFYVGNKVFQEFAPELGAIMAKLAADTIERDIDEARAEDREALKKYYADRKKLPKDQKTNSFDNTYVFEEPSKRGTVLSFGRIDFSSIKKIEEFVNQLHIDVDGDKIDLSGFSLKQARYFAEGLLDQLQLSGINYMRNAVESYKLLNGVKSTSGVDNDLSYGWESNYKRFYRGKGELPQRWQLMFEKIYHKDHLRLRPEEFEHDNLGNISVTTLKMGLDDYFDWKEDADKAEINKALKAINEYWNETNWTHKKNVGEFRTQLEELLTDGSNEMYWQTFERVTGVNVNNLLEMSRGSKGVTPLKIRERRVLKMFRDRGIEVDFVAFKKGEDLEEIDKRIKWLEELFDYHQIAPGYFIDSYGMRVKFMGWENQGAETGGINLNDIGGKITLGGVEFGFKEDMYKGWRDTRKGLRAYVKKENNRHTEMTRQFMYMFVPPMYYSDNVDTRYNSLWDRQPPQGDKALPKELLDLTIEDFWNEMEGLWKLYKKDADIFKRNYRAADEKGRKELEDHYKSISLGSESYDSLNVFVEEAYINALLSDDKPSPYAIAVAQYFDALFGKNHITTQRAYQMRKFRQFVDFKTLFFNKLDKKNKKS